MRGLNAEKDCAGIPMLQCCETGLAFFFWPPGAWAIIGLTNPIGYKAGFSAGKKKVVSMKVGQSGS